MAGDNIVELIIGKRGHGKSLWTKLSLRSTRRLIVHDIMGSYKVDEWLTGAELADRVEGGWFDKRRNFRLGVYDADDIEVTGASAFLVGDLDLVIEEAGVLFEKMKKPPRWLRDLMFLGRHRGVRLKVTAQRAASIPIDLRSQASRIVTFAQHEKADLQALRPYFDERVDELPTLPVYWCLDWDGVKVKRYSIEAAAKRWIPKT